MPIKSYKVGPGVFTAGAAGTLQTFTAQVTKLEVGWSEDSEDAVPTLSGEDLEGDTTYTAELSATVFQDLTPGGMVEWSWTNKGQTFPFSYTPNSSDTDLEEATITGTLKVSPIKVGGEPKKRATSDLTWKCVGEPILTHAV